jgi:hypothetical protein
MARREPSPSQVYATVLFGSGGFGDFTAPDGPPWNLVHLAPWSMRDGAHGRLLCGIDRFADRTPDGLPMPGWTVGGGVAGPTGASGRCPDCDAARIRTVPVSGMYAHLFQGAGTGRSTIARPAFRHIARPAQRPA